MGYIGAGGGDGRVKGGMDVAHVSKCSEFSHFLCPYYCIKHACKLFTFDE